MAAAVMTLASSLAVLMATRPLSGVGIVFVLMVRVTTAELMSHETVAGDPPDAGGCAGHLVLPETLASIH